MSSSRASSIDGSDASTLAPASEATDVGDAICDETAPAIRQGRKVTLESVASFFKENKDFLLLKGAFDPVKGLPADGSERKKQEAAFKALDKSINEADDYHKHLEHLRDIAFSLNNVNPSNQAVAVSYAQGDVTEIGRIRDKYKQLFPVDVPAGSSRPSLEERKNIAESIREQTRKLLEELFPDLFRNSNNVS